MMVVTPQFEKTLLRLVVAAFCVCALAAPAQSAPTVNAVSPGSGAPGDPVTLHGSTLGGLPGDYFGWVSTGPGSGFQLVPTAVAATTLDAVVGPVAAPATGTVELWRGRSHALPDRVVLTSGRLVTAFGGRVFVGEQGATGPFFTAIAGQPWVNDSILLCPQRMLRSHLPWATANNSYSVFFMRLVVVMEDDGEGCADGEAFQSTGDSSRVALDDVSSSSVAGGGVRFAFESLVRLDAPVSTVGELAQAVASVLDPQLAGLGVTVSANGGILELVRPSGLSRGFVTVEALAPQ